MVLLETLKHHFHTLGVEVEDGPFLNKCLDLCDLYGETEELFVEKWIAFMVAKSTNLEPTLESLDQIERSVLKKDNKTTLAMLTGRGESSPLSINSPRSTRNFADDEGNILAMYGFKGPTPNVKRIRSPDGSDSPGIQQNKVRALETTFSPASYTKKPQTPRRLLDDRKRGTILHKFGEDVLDWKTTDNWQVQVGKTSDPHVPIQPQYMFELLSKKASFMQRVCRKYGAKICSTWCKISDKDAPSVTSNVRKQSQSNFRTWGRIVCEMDGKLNSTAMMLEGCKNISPIEDRATVPLNLSKIQQYSMFPGQIIAVEGTNPTGNELIVQQIFSSGYIQPPLAPNINKNLHLVVASGPFTDSDTLDYQPLFHLMDHVANTEPHVLILVGPFVFANHSEIQKPTLVNTFQELFEQIIEKTMKCVKGKCTQVVLIPSHQDAHHHPIFPTPEYFLPKSMQSPNLHLMPDPSMLDIEGLTIGATSVDIIRHLGGEEVNLNMTGMDRLGRLANHVLSQGCFYPLYPPPREINIDTKMWEQYAFMRQQPHILLLPSDMRYFCKWTHDCLVINPERLNKHSYARIIVKPSPDGKWTEQQIDCEILKI